MSREELSRIERRQEDIPLIGSPSSLISQFQRSLSLSSLGRMTLGT